MTTTKTTITEALAELKTIGKRIDKKREFIENYLYRQEALRDPLEKDGGSATAIAREFQALIDLNQRIIAIRRAIAAANANTEVTIGETTRTVADWLTWRREVAPGQQRHLRSVAHSINQMRGEAQRRGFGVLDTDHAGSGKPQDFVVNINELTLAQEIERLEERLGQLDGQLSLINATTLIEY